MPHLEVTSDWTEWSERAANVGEVFRGGIIENAKRFRFIGDGYKAMPPEQDGYFKLESARQIEGPCSALTHPMIRIVHLIGAVQVLKSFVADLWVPYVVEHEKLPMMALFEDFPKADAFCAMRLITTLKAHPTISKMFEDAKKDDRFSVTGTWVRTLFSQLLVGGLNDGNTSTLSWPRLWFSESWLHGPPVLTKGDGLLFKGIKRADRFADSCKILNESQPGLADSDLHIAVRDAFPVPLTFACPACGGRQTFEQHHWFYKRPADFVPRQQTKIQILSTGIQVEAPVPKPGTFAGMRWPGDKEGKMTLEERARQAYWECLFCGYHIEDTKANRQRLAESYRQVFWRGGNPDDKIPENVNLLPAAREVWFTLPYEANVTNPFEKTVLNYLVADRAKNAGNEVPLIDWFLAERAHFYSKGNTLAVELAPVTGSYNPAEIIDQHSINIFVDCQKALDAGPDEDRMGSFWVIVHAWNKRGDSFQLWRGFCTSIEQVLAIKKKYGIPNGRMCIDGGKWLHDILDLAALHYEESEKVFMGRKYTTKETWRVFRGDDAMHFLWSLDPRQKPKAYTYSLPHAYPRVVTKNGERMTVNVYVYRWSNTAIKDQLIHVIEDSAANREGAIKIHALDYSQLDETTRDKEKGDLTWEKQINAEYPTVKRGRRYWEKKRPDNHYWDCLGMELVRKHQDGLAGGIIDVTAVVQAESESAS